MIHCEMLCRTRKIKNIFVWWNKKILNAWSQGLVYTVQTPKLIHKQKKNWSYKQIIKNSNVQRELRGERNAIMHIMMQQELCWLDCRSCLMSARARCFIGQNHQITSFGLLTIEKSPVLAYFCDRLLSLNCFYHEVHIAHIKRYEKKATNIESLCETFQFTQLFDEILRK